MIKILPITSNNGRDLFCEFKCTCPNQNYKDNSVLFDIMKTTIRLSGYNDNYFFNVVNKDKREYECACGKKYKYQWKAHGVEISEGE